MDRSLKATKLVSLFVYIRKRTKIQKRIFKNKADIVQLHSFVLHFQRYSKVFEKLDKKVDKENIVEEKLFVQIQNLGPKDVFVSCIC